MKDKNHILKNIRILISERVLHTMAQRVRAHRDCEDGGKLLGYTNQDLTKIEVHAEIASGPKAVRTSVELLPDGPFQEEVFRVLEFFHPAIEHIGSWHSHTPNGLDHLSSGDVRGYIKTVNDPRYHATLFLALLAIRSVDDYRQWLEGQGIKVYVTWPGCRGQEVHEVPFSQVDVIPQVSHGPTQPVPITTREEPRIGVVASLKSAQRAETVAPRENLDLAFEENFFRQARIASKVSFVNGTLLRRFTFDDYARGALIHDPEGVVTSVVLEDRHGSKREVSGLQDSQWLVVLLDLLKELKLQEQRVVTVLHRFIITI
jgi:hypothetical protein